LGSDRVASIMTEPTRKVLISKLGFIEIQSVLAIKVRSGQISRDEASLQRARLMGRRGWANRRLEHEPRPFLQG
jgi:hypothetical protein